MWSISCRFAAVGGTEEEIRKRLQAKRQCFLKAVMTVWSATTEASWNGGAWDLQNHRTAKTVPLVSVVYWLMVSNILYIPSPGWILESECISEYPLPQVYYLSSKNSSNYRSWLKIAPRNTSSFLCCRTKNKAKQPRKRQIMPPLRICDCWP